MNSAMEAMRRYIAANAVLAAEMSYDDALKRGLKPESPIEEAMLLGLIHLSTLLPNVGVGREPAFAGRGGRTAIITTQEPIGEYRSDFLVSVFKEGKPVGRIVLECDGHQFHERSKEQVARDRSRDRMMTNDGYTVLRFTGSEIFNRPDEVLADVIKAILNAWARDA